MEKHEPTPSAAEKLYRKCSGDEDHKSGVKCESMFGIEVESRHSGQAVDAAEATDESHRCVPSLPTEAHNEECERDWWDKHEYKCSCGKTWVFHESVGAHWTEAIGQAVDRQEFNICSSKEWFELIEKCGDNKEHLATVIASRCRSELAAERQRAEQAEQLYNTGLKHREVIEKQLLSALEAIETAIEHFR